MVRGIQNVSGVSCHIACALQLVAHTVTPLVQFLHALRPWLSPHTSTTDDAAVWKELVHGWCALTATDHPNTNESVGSPWDPTQLYLLLRQQTSLDPDTVGDVSSALYQLWQSIRKQSQEHETLIDYFIGGGTTQQYICGRKIVNNQTVTRTKQGKIKPMACPFPLSSFGSHHDSVEVALQELLSASFETGTVLEGYDWDAQPQDSYAVEEHPVEENSSSGEETEWTTTKFTKLVTLPKYLFLSLERFSYNSNGERIWKEPEISIPTQFTLVNNTTWTLKGAVIHITEESLDEEGHYATLVPSSDPLLWTLIDDEKCQSVDADMALQWMSGIQNGGSSYGAVLVSYGPNPDGDDDELTKLTEPLLERYRSEFVDWSVPESLVGRKLKIRWAKGTFYEGVVDHYDAATGKHRVLYKDGDVREYILSKKTIEWIR